jgi:hypothetical protein
VLRRAKTWGYDPHNMMWKLLSFHAPPLLEIVQYVISLDPNYS